MSSHAANKIDQKEYLKKYLSGDKSKKKKKEKKRKKDIGATKVKIIDDDANAFQTQAEIDEELLLGGEDAPQIVGEYIEERSNGVSVSKWRSIDVKEEPLDDDCARVVKREPDDDLWGRKASTIKIKDEFSPTHRVKLKKRRHVTPDASPPRRGSKRDKSNNSDNRRRSASFDYSPPRKSTKSKSRHDHGSNSDMSPPRNSRHEQSPYRKIRISPGSRKERLSRSPDQSPPRKTQRSPVSRKKRRSCSADQSPPRKMQHSPLSLKERRSRSLDKSPPRKIRRSPINRNERRSRSVDQSPPRKARHSPVSRSQGHSGSIDLSPPRKEKRQDQSPPRRSKHVDGKKSRRSRSADQSPVRKRSHKTASRHRNRSLSNDQSPPRQRKRNNSLDQSPPRRRGIEHSKKRSASPEKRRQEYSTDQSPPRRRPQNYSNLSPSRRVQRNSVDQSPPRRNKKQTSPTRSRNHIKSSPPIKREKLSPDQSPPRRPTKIKSARSPTPPRRSRWEKQEVRKLSESPPPTHKPKPSKTLDGKKAGLQDAKSLQIETDERREREDRMYNEMSKEMSGRDADVQVRSTGRRGKRAREAAALDPEEQRRKEEREREKKEKYDRWGKGLKQVEDYRERLEADAYESSKPLARYANDEDLDKYLREQERADDPMLQYMRKKRKEQQKADGVSEPVKLKYEGAYPENRFGIAPGYQWDGVDRSNGYEKKWFEKQNEKRALQEEAYKYSIEDM